MPKDRGKLPSPTATTIAGTLDELAKKYKAVADMDMRAPSSETVAKELQKIAKQVEESGKSFGAPEAYTIAGSLDALCKKYKAAADFDFSVPTATNISGTIDELAKKYKGQV